MSLPVIRPISKAQLLALDPTLDFPTVAEAGYVEGSDTPIAIGGLSWRWGRCWLWYRIIDRKADIHHPNLVVGTARRMLKKAAGPLGESVVFAWRDAGEPSSKRLLKVLGFKFIGIEPIQMVDGSLQDREVWAWPIQSRGQQSQRSAA